MDEDSISKNKEYFPLIISETEIIHSVDQDSGISNVIPDSSDDCKEILSCPIKETDDCVSLDEELSAKILQQVEYLFSDENLSKDNFLLKHIRRDKNGYVSLKLIASSRKLRKLTRDWKVVAHSLLPSQKLEMNSEMTKIRRLEPIPDDPKFSTFTKVLIFDMPPTVKTEEDVRNLLKSFGKVIDVSIISPDNALGSKYCTPSCKSMCASTYAIAEFESFEEALRATEHISNADRSFVVSPLLDNSRIWKKPRSPLPSHRNQQFRKSNCDSWWKLSSPEDSNSSDDMIQSPPRISEFASFASLRKPRRHWKRSNSANDQRDNQCMFEGNVENKSTWNLKRQMSGKQNKNGVIIIRQPRGPDGTIGFHAGRAKANLETQAP